MSERHSSHHASRPAIGIRAKTAARPLAAAEVDAATLVELTDVTSSTLDAIVNALPDPSALAPGHLVVVPTEIAGGKSFTRSLMAAFGRKKHVPRTRVCTALVVRGYVDVGASDSESGEHAWGRVPAAPLS